MAGIIGLLRIRVRRGIRLAVRDLGTHTSDPYVVVTMGNQKLKTSVVKKNCNPVWNEDLTFSVYELDAPIHLRVYDKDRFTEDDKMGEAEIDIKPYIASLRMGLRNLPNGCVVSRVQPNKKNCLADESPIVWNSGNITQDMFIRLKNVESGELELQLQWIEFTGCRGLGIDDTC